VVGSGISVATSGELWKSGMRDRITVQ
jgi:hypothetical protein